MGSPILSLGLKLAKRQPSKLFLKQRSPRPRSQNSLKSQWLWRKRKKLSPKNTQQPWDLRDQWLMQDAKGVARCLLADSPVEPFGEQTFTDCVINETLNPSTTVLLFYIILWDFI